MKALMKQCFPETLKKRYKKKIFKAVSGLSYVGDTGQVQIPCVLLSFKLPVLPVSSLGLWQLHLDVLMLKSEG
jgi:hypothetical protein